eukprot:COSAG02_NODE_14163_length_1302_cov_1.230258_1_plen_396_part_10
MASPDRWGRAAGHPDHAQPPALAAVLTQTGGGGGLCDWRLADDTLVSAFVSAAHLVPGPRSTVVYEIMSHSDRRCCFAVVRRFSDFVAFAADIRKELFFAEEFVAALPEVPGGGVMSFLTTDTDPQSRFVQERKQALENYLKELMGVGAAEKSRSFRRFMLDRVYAHDWAPEAGADAAEPALLRSGVVIETSDFRAASQLYDDDSSSDDSDLDDDGGGSCTSSGGGATPVVRISEEELQARRDAEERRLQEQQQPPGAGTGCAVSSDGGDSGTDGTTVASPGAAAGPAQSAAVAAQKQQRRAERAAQKEKELRRRQRKEAKAARERARHELLSHTDGVVPATPQPEHKPEPERKPEPEHKPAPAAESKSKRRSTSRRSRSVSNSPLEGDCGAGNTA